MKYNVVVFFIISSFNLFKINGEEPEPNPQYVPKYLQDTYDWANSHVPSLDDLSFGFGKGGTDSPNSVNPPHSGVKTSGVKTSGVKTSGVKTSGVKTGHTSQEQSGVKTGGSSKYKGGCSTAPTIYNANTKCSVYSGCRATCIPNHIFPNGHKTLLVTCVDGNWEVEGTEWGTIPSCEPVCNPPCANNGICMAPNVCNCPENYSGPQCQVETKRCIKYPPMPMNAGRKCSTTSCTITCMKGHEFPDGSTITNMICSNGLWVPSKPDWSKIPDCKATCNPPCQNGGNCLALNVCQCPQQFRGPQCQYSTDACKGRKLGFNGGYKCSGVGDVFSCTLSCPAGVQFEFPPAPKYTCNYAVGKFFPSPVPQCLYGSNVVVVPIGGTSNITYIEREGDHSSSSGIHMGGQLPGHGDEDVWTQTHINKTHYTKPNGESSIHETNNTGRPGQGIYGIDEDGNVILGTKPKTGNCFTWGGSHFKTFDGKVFSFNSLCTHTLIRDAIDNTFSVVVKNSKVCARHPDSCHKTIKIYLQDREYTLKHSGHGVPVFSSGKKILPVPGRVPGIRIEMSAHYFVVMLDTIGAVLKWDGKQFVQVEATESLWNRTAGLCGKLDGNPSNDMLTKEGISPRSVVTLASSWQVDVVGDTCLDTPTEEHVCQDTSQEGHKASQFCNDLLNDKRFSSCRKIMDVSLLLDACRWDYCASNSSHRQEFACETLNVYVRECSLNGIKQLSNWRDENTCPITCTGGRVYMPCGPIGGQKICGAASERADDNAVCEEGCYCPEGTVLHDSKCVTKNECPCLYRGKYHAPQSSIPSDCNTCTCVEGEWICTKVTCGARCSALGDPHYITFDGKRYDFMGQCNYVLVKHDNFTIEAENVACAGSISQAMNFPISVSSGLPSCTKTVTIKISGQTIKLKQNHEVVVNGQEVTKIPLNIGGVRVRAVSSIFLIAELPNGVEVWWDGLTRAYIDVPASFIGQKTKGLCGTFNANQKDDFLTPYGDVEHSPIAFANKWKTTEKCNDIPDIIKSHPCEVNIHNKETAIDHCDVINSVLFTDCHSEVDPEPFYKDCLFDMCSCESKISKCLCPIIASYAAECAAKGIKVDWRNDVRECGVHCSGGQKYQVCGNSCTRSCNDLANDDDCKPQCVEGCNCQEGEAMDVHGECIPVGECGCQYEGLTFNAGYKEVRPAAKAPELCTCVNAQWDCKPATPEEIKNFPPANDLKSLCKASENKEFTTCEPVEPVTCKNMHSEELFSSAICHAGCQCKDGYVLDTFSKVCVKPTDCPCHHGGRSYTESSVIHSDCNNCTCQHGKWSCTEEVCPSECSAWGDSHYKTFDGKLYDYQGECDYILAKGSVDYLSFDISIQNVPCSSLGVSCSKSITITVGTAPDQESLILTRGKEIPTHAMLKHMTLRQIGKYVIVEAPEVGFIVKWDRGTRVYVKLNTLWKNKVKGLCGNYNDDQMDDFQTPSGGMAEVSVKLFGDSWRLQPYCPEAVEITDTCAQRPDRKVWALKKCGILKSPVFAVCHSEIPVETYLKKCIFDTCACDQGGDCECLCTALAAYAQECSNKGIHIKWRTPDLCPMQCDEHCSNYSPCISTCSVETCDNTLVQSKLSQSCGKETCVEGCQVKKCKEGFIYLNSSFVECVPKNICKPICLTIGEKTYYEGDLIEEDDCHSCYCSLGKKTCKGQPCVTILPQEVTEAPNTQPVICVDGWTSWINQNVLPNSKTHKEDVEPLPEAIVMNKLIGSHCNVENITDIECRTTSTHVSAKETGLDAECSLENGLYCRSPSGTELCPDFEIRVKCGCGAKSCDITNAHLPHPDCQHFYHCEPGDHGNVLFVKVCGPGTWFNPVTSVCDFPSNVIQVRPECGSTGVTEGYVTFRPPIEPPPPGGNCLDWEEYDPCLIECSKTCQYYTYSLKHQGYCQAANGCVDGCYSADKKINCPPGMFWANNYTCVAEHDCMCVSNLGKPVKPGVVIYETYCKVCQCIDNFYTCDESSCPSVTIVPPAISENGTALPVSEIYTVSTHTPPPFCSENDYINLIDGETPLSDDIFSASSTQSKNFAPKYGRLHKSEEPDSEKSWSPKLNAKNQFLQINLGKQEPIYGIIVRGNPATNRYITSFQVYYTPDGHSYNYIADFNRKPQTFRGPIDAVTPVKRIFDIPIEAQILKIKPMTWSNGIALNVDLIGCGKYVTLEPPVTPPSPVCIDPMGVGDGKLADQQISVSSELAPHHTKGELKLTSKFGWQPITNSPSEWVQFNFLEPRNLTGFVTKGGSDGWVTAFNVKYSANGIDWNPVVDDQWKEQVFMGNFDENSPESISLDSPIQAQYLKIIPVEWHRNIQLRIEPHGCFEPYPLVTYPTEPPISECNSCPGASPAELELGACRCDEGLWWDDTNCVKRTECPCFVGHMAYAIGSVFHKDDCSDCICRLGGISHCTPKVCGKCEKGLRSVVTSTCGCICKACDEGTTLCPTSNICINSTAWCNGVKDCPDDETGCAVTLPPIVIPTFPPPTSPTKPPVQPCPKPICPPDYNVVIVKSSKTNIKTMFSRNVKSVKTSTRPSGVKGRTKGGTKGGIKTGGSGGRPGGHVQTVIVKPEKEVYQQECDDFRCVPPITRPNVTEVCEPAVCVAGYVPLYVSNPHMTESGYCPTYICELIPPPDASCNITGRTFNTFDSTEYKYDICNHVIARDIANYSWEILLKKNCSNVSCSRDLVIEHEDHVIVLHPNFMIEYDGYQYTVEQTKLIGNHFHAFEITPLGDKLVFSSNKYGFWVIWDRQSNVQVGVSQKLLGKVDGLCGYFNGKSIDDKRKPDGTPAKATVEFGNSWELPDSSIQCEIQTCPNHIQTKAWTICNLIKEKPFEPCAPAIDVDAFVSRCLESACNCLEAAGDDKSAQDNCRCQTLQNFVVDCLVTNSNIEVVDWRMIHDCPAVCPPPLVHNDCFKRRCEPSCSSISDPDICPKFDNLCFPGCYCPPGYVRKGANCILPTSCGDCECNVLPHLKYETYDHSNFSITGNCVYVMSRDVEDNKNDHKFQVLITNAPCQDKKDRMCVGKITILYNGHKIHVMRDLARKRLRLVVDAEHVSDFGEVSSWMTVKEEMKHFKIFLDAIQVKVSIYYPSLGVSVKAPSLKYGGKLEGLCGDCNGNTDNDYRKPDGSNAKDLDDFGTSWLYENLPGGQDKNSCKNKEELTCVEVPVDQDPCIQLVDIMKYGQCHPVLDPGMFIEWCKQDTCNGNPQFSCQSIESYSSECGQLGFCVDWRTKLCPAKDCPLDQVYKPCGPKCTDTCESLKKKNNKCNNPPIEGCFCPEGKVLLNGTCVVKDRCEACDDEGHHSGDSWMKDKCTNCTCEGTTVKCEVQNCPSVDIICQDGYNPLKVTTVKDCCDKFICVPMPTSATTCEPPQQMQCGAGQIMKVITGYNGCQQFVCSCKPIEECEPVNQSSSTPPPGIVRTIDTSGCCPVLVESCDSKQCPKQDPCPQFYNPDKTEIPGVCCPQYLCLPPEEKCIATLQYTADEKGGERPRNDFEKQQVLKESNETWKDGPCRDCICNKSPVGDTYSSCSITECPSLTDSVDHNDYYLSLEPVVGVCCPNVKKTACKHNGKIYKVGDKWPVEGDYCTTIECIDTPQGIQKLTNIQSCRKTCDLGSEYFPATPESKQCCGSCKPVACVVDGVVHEVDDKWASPDFCVNFFCLNLNGSIQIQSVVVTCTEISEELLHDFVVETIPIYGECCPKHKVTACKVGSNTYKVGETWPSPDGNKCKTVKCVANALGEITKQDSVETCNKNCSLGSEYKKSSTKCCGECVQVACVVDNTLKKPGENWTSSDGCTTFSCNKIGNQFTVASHQDSCPNVDDCPPKDIYQVGCCKHCNVTSGSSHACAPKTMRPLDTIGIVKVNQVTRGKCTNKEAIIGFTECDGTCSSSTKYNHRTGLHDSVCKCCQPSKFSTLFVTLQCDDGSPLRKSITIPSECDCSKACANTGIKQG